MTKDSLYFSSTLSQLHGDSMAKWTEHLPHLHMPQLHVPQLPQLPMHASEAKEFLLGGTSTMDQVFLSHQTPNPEKPASPEAVTTKTTDKFDFSGSSKGLNCYQVTVSSIVIIALTCFLLVVCRDYIKDVLVWMAKVDLTVSFFIFVLLYIVVSYPVAWGVILLMIACGYLYGLIYGPMVVVVCSGIGVAVAHVTMKKFCRSFIIQKFYNDNMTAVISVVGGKHGFKVVALTRLTPLPFGLQNSLFSLTDIPLLSYVSASCLGIAPTAVLNCYMGTTLRSMNDILTDETNQKTGYIVLVVQILFTVALMYFVVRKARVELKKTVETPDEVIAGVTEVIIHNDGSEHSSFSEHTKTNGYIENSRHKRMKSAD